MRLLEFPNGNCSILRYALNFFFQSTVDYKIDSFQGKRRESSKVHCLSAGFFSILEIPTFFKYLPLKERKE